MLWYTFSILQKPQLNTYPVRMSIPPPKQATAWQSDIPANGSAGTSCNQQANGTQRQINRWMDRQMDGLIAAALNASYHK